MTNNYVELYKRNWPILPVEIQEKLSRLKVGIAGCGSTGGGFIDGLLRLGIQFFHLTDNGDYELNNLNRQFVELKDLNKNKAAVHAERIARVNSEAKTRVWPEGLTEQNIYDFVDGCDFVFDAVDVTTEAGMKMKLRLHEVLHEKRIPTGSALDLGFVQWLESYNYHQGEALLKGKMAQAKACKNPLKALIAGFSPIDDLDLEIAEEITRLIMDPKESCSQLACACFALAAMVTPYMMYFADTGKLPGLVKLDLLEKFPIPLLRKDREQRTLAARGKLAELLESIP